MPTHNLENNSIKAPAWTGLKAIKSQIAIRATELLNQQQAKAQAAKQHLSSSELNQLKPLLLRSLESKAREGNNQQYLAVLRQADLRVNAQQQLEIVLNNHKEAQSLEAKRSIIARELHQAINYVGEFQIVCSPEPKRANQPTYYLSNELYAKWSQEYPCIASLKEDLGFDYSPNY